MMVSRHERRGDEPARDSDDTLDSRNGISDTMRTSTKLKLAWHAQRDDKLTLYVSEAEPDSEANLNATPGRDGPARAVATLCHGGRQLLSPGSNPVGPLFFLVSA